MNNLIYGGCGIHEFPTSIEEALLGLAVAGDFTGAKVILFTDTDIAPGDVKKLAFADLTVPTFTGYASSAAITWGAAFIDLDGNVMQTANKVQFLCSADSPGALPVTGAALVDGAGAVLLAVDLFLNPDGTPNPVTMESAGDALDYVPRFAFVDKNNQ